MPFQFGWAAAAAYCAHESGAAVQHFGHHEHEHHAVDPDSGEATKAPSGAGLFDVADCHGHCACAVVLPVSVDVPLIAHGLRPEASPAFGTLPPVRSRPERPQWTHHA